MTAQEVVSQFYEAFKRLDGDAMARMYSPTIEFSDPVFPKLVGADAGDMWRMLCSRSKSLKVEYLVAAVAGNFIHVNWDARYPFSKTGRLVHNKIRSELTVVNNQITRHHDHFDFWSWSRQALGLSGILLGWSPVIRSKVRRQAALSLKSWQQRFPLG